MLKPPHTLAGFALQRQMKTKAVENKPWNNHLTQRRNSKFATCVALKRHHKFSLALPNHQNRGKKKKIQHRSINHYPFVYNHFYLISFLVCYTSIWMSPQVLCVASCVRAAVCLKKKKKSFLSKAISCPTLRGILQQCSLLALLCASLHISTHLADSSPAPPHTPKTPQRLQHLLFKDRSNRQFVIVEL